MEWDGLAVQTAMVPRAAGWKDAWAAQALMEGLASLAFVAAAWGEQVAPLAGDEWRVAKAVGRWEAALEKQAAQDVQEPQD